MARRAIPIIAFHGVESIYIYIYILVSLARVCVVYVVKEVRHSRGLGQLMGVARNRTRTRALQTSRKKTACSYT